MPLKRKIAMMIAMIFGLYVVFGLTSLIMYYRSDIRRYYLEDAQTRTIPHQRMQMLKERVAQNPDDLEATRDLRELDYQLRKVYFTQKPLYAWASVTMVLALAAMIAALRAFFNFAPAPGLSVLEPGHKPGVRTKKERQTAMKGLYIAGAVLALVLIAIGITMSPTLPPADYGKVATAPVEAQPTPTPTPTPLPEEPSIFEENWPAFRGPGNIGIATGKGPWPKEWDLPLEAEGESKNIAWAVPCTLDGKSSPIVWGNYIFVTGGSANEISVACYERKTGKMLWTKAVQNVPGSADFEPYPDTGFAAPTPTTDGERVYAMYGNGVLAAFDFAGNQVWMRNFGVPDSMYSFSASLIFHDGLLLMQFDQGMSEMDELSRMMAFDPKTGETKWEAPRPVANSWSSPSIINTGERTILLTTSLPWIIAYNPTDGEEYWRFEGMYGDVGPSPAWNGKYIFITNDGAELFAIRPGGEGNVTDSHKAWSAYDGLPDTCSPVATKDYVLQVGAGGYLTCFKTESDGDEGVMLWEEFLPVSATASPILVDDLVYLMADDGTMYIIELADEYKLLTQNALNQRVAATPAFADGRIYVRSSSQLICIEDPALVDSAGGETPEASEEANAE